MPPKKNHESVFDSLGHKREELFCCRINQTASRSIYPGVAPLRRREPPRPDPPVVCPGFGFDRSHAKHVQDLMQHPEITTCRFKNWDIPRAGRRGTAHGWARKNIDSWFAENTSVPRIYKHNQKSFLNIQIGGKQKFNSYSKSTRKQKSPLTPGPSAFHRCDCDCS